MGQLIYSAICSLDGFTTDRSGQYDWAYPGEEVIAAINADMARYSTYLYGRGIYQEMVGWETDPQLAESSPESAEFARLWRAAEKVVYSTTQPEIVTSRTRLETTFEADAVRALKESAAGDLTVDGPTLAATAFALGVVDEVDLVLVPTTVGGGLRTLPADVRLDLELTSTRRFANGMVQVRYDVRGTEPARGV